MSATEQGATTHMDLRHRRIKRIAALVAALGLLGGLAIAPANVSAEKGAMVTKVATGRVPASVVETGSISKKLVTISGGNLKIAKSAAEDIQGEKEVAADFDPRAESDQFSVTPGSLGCSTRNSGGGGVRVNQDCTFRRQAEELIKINPIDPNNIIAGQNDSRVGYNKCGFDYSFDAGKTWGDGIPPFYQKENRPENDLPTGSNPNRNTILGGRGTHHTYDAGSDPALTFDSAGRAFFSCVVFDVNTNASGILVTQSPQGAGGSFYDNVAAAGRNFVAVEDNNDPDPVTGIFPRVVFHDKEFVSADYFPTSPNKDNVYLTWTVFDFKNTCRDATPISPNFCSSAIFGSMSTDHGLTWSTPEEISGNSPTLCFFGNFFDPTQSPSACNLDQGSDPVVLPDGRLAVVFFNQNTGPTDPNFQQLNVTCSPSGSSSAGTAKFNCGTPTKVGTDVFAGEPQCNFGRGPEECIPGPWIRTNDFPRMAVDKLNGALYAVWQDYRNAEFDIVISRSNDGGATWEEGDKPVNKFEFFDEYMPAIDVGSHHNVAVSFYKSVRVPNENTTPPGGFAPGQPGVQASGSTYNLAGRLQPTQFVQTPFTQVQITNVFAPPDGVQAGFNGDYSGIAAVNSRAHPIWSDTRNTAVETSPNQGVVHDEDVFTDDLEIPHP
jgi:hypothetical protein